MSGFCSAVNKHWVGRRELWAKCRLAPHHEGPHHDPKFQHHYWNETFFAFEFDYGRPVKTKTVRKVRLCKKCGQEKRTDGSNEACVCKEIGANRKQGIMFAEERTRTAHAIAAKDLQDDIDWIEAVWARNAAADPDAYYGEF